MNAREILNRYAAGERNFRRANLRGQSFKGQNLSGADFTEADIHGANFTNATLKGEWEEVGDPNEAVTGTQAAPNEDWTKIGLYRSRAIV